jgi:D-alanyl-D-alanine carboxypeptidase (penicillin-binding protein 5/6)
VVQYDVNHFNKESEEVNRFGFVRKKVAWVLGASLLVQSAIFHINPSSVQAADPAPALNLEVKSAILMEASTGQILYENNADVALPPASMAKMMTEYLVLESIQDGKLKWEDSVTASKNASDVIGSGQLIAEGETLTVKDMFAAMSIYSANDASVALAERIGGTEENFAKMMNETAKKLGMSDQAHFINATGLSRADMKTYAPTSIEGETLMTAKDAAILAQHIVTEHKEVLDFTKITNQKLREKDTTAMLNWNWMLEGNANNANTSLRQYAYQGLDGLKTGHTDEAKYCFTGTAERNGLRIISVVMGAETEPKRFIETRKLLDYGFTNFEIKSYLGPDLEIDSLKTVNIKKGVETEVGLVTEKGTTFVVKKGAADDHFKLTAEPVEESQLVAPITKGQKLGTLKVTYEGQEQTINLVAKDDVKKGGMFRLLFRSIGNFFSDMFSGIKDMF